MRYIESLHIETFKGLEDVKLENCGDINIIVGDNNTCKTSVLEAIHLMNKPLNPQEVLALSRRRDSQYRSTALPLFDSFNNMFDKKQKNNEKYVKINFISNGEKNVFSINGQIKQVYYTENDLEKLAKQSSLLSKMTIDHDEQTPVRAFSGRAQYNKLTVQLNINDVVNFPSYFVWEDTDKTTGLNTSYVSSSDYMYESKILSAFSELILAEKKKSLLDLLNLFDKNITEIEMVSSKYSDKGSIQLKNKQLGFMPVSSYGDGIKKVLSIASAVLSSENGVILLDEIETAIHTSALSDVYNWLLKTAKERKLQIFLTTHSDEALRSFLINNEIHNLDMVIYRLENFNDKIISRRFSGEKASRIIIENGGDLR